MVSGENRAKDAAEQAITSALLDVSIDGARAILFNIKGGEELSLFEVNEAAEIIRANTHPESNIIFGAVVDPAMKDEVAITVIATGFDRNTSQDTLGFSQPSYEPRTQYAPRPSEPRSFGQPVGNQRPSEEDRYDEHSQELPPVPTPEDVEPQKGRSDGAVRNFDREDLDIPAFLRRNRNRK